MIAGFACAMLGKPEAALAHFADFRRIEPHSPYQHYAFAWQAGCFLQLGDWAAAEEAFDSCLALNPDANHALCQKAVVVRHLGRIEEARQLMIEGRRREPAATLAMWELRLTRWNTADAMLIHLRALWAETEGMT